MTQKNSNLIKGTYIGISPFDEAPRIGALRTFLYIYVYARKYNIPVYIKSDDTNPNGRDNDNFNNQISILNGLGATFTETELHYFQNSIIHQSKNNEIYEIYLNKLIEAKVTSEKDGLISLDVQLLANKLNVEILKINDLLKNRIFFNFQNSGYTFIPLYSLSNSRFFFHIPCVVDEELMGVSVSIRGEDKISVAPIHDLLRVFFEMHEIEYLHLPLLLNPDTGKRIKGPQYSILEFLSIYPKEVIISYLLESGCNINNKHFWDLDSFINIFDFSMLKKQSGFYNHQYIEKLNVIRTKNLIQ